MRYTVCKIGKSFSRRERPKVLLRFTHGRTSGGGGGEGCHPLRVFPPMFLRPNNVSSCCSFILETNFGKFWRQSVAMVKRYYVISILKPFLNKNAYLSPIFGVKPYKIQPKAAKCLIASYLTTLAKKLFAISEFSLNFEFLVKSKMAAISDDVKDLSSAIIFTSSCRSHDRLSIKGKIFSKHRKNPGEGLQQPPLYHGGGIIFCIPPRVKGRQLHQIYQTVLFIAYIRPHQIHAIIIIIIIIIISV